LSFFDYEVLEKFRKDVAQVIMDHVITKNCLDESNNAEVKRIFDDPIQRFAWAIQQRIKSLRQIAHHGITNCFGGCGQSLSIIGQENIECSWSTFMQRLRKEKEEMKTIIEGERISKCNEEISMNFGDKICKSCYAERERRWKAEHSEICGTRVIYLRWYFCNEHNAFRYLRDLYQIWFSNAST
jgi:hypothetical protein